MYETCKNTPMFYLQIEYIFGDSSVYYTFKTFFFLISINYCQAIIYF